MKLAVIQMSMGNDGEQNIHQACDRIQEAAKHGAEWILLPELVHLPYPGQVQDPSWFDYAVVATDPLFDPLRDVAARMDLHIALPFFEKRMPGVYANSLMLLTPEAQAEPVYRKTHIPHDPGFSEKYYFTPGEKGYCLWNREHLPVAPLICWDQWFPEAARICTLQGAELLLYPTAIGWLPEETEEVRAAMLDAWRTVQRSHAITNGVFVATANRCGFEPHPEDANRGIDFWGHSFICSPSGTLLAEAGQAETILYADLDRGEVETTRRTWPFLRDRRIDLYAPLLLRHD